MADQLATVADLQSLLETTLDSTKATILIESATAVVQEACGGQRIVQVVGDTLTTSGNSDNWFALPQLPVTTVTSVTIDGSALTVNTDYKVFGNRLWRKQGWQSNYGWPWDYPYGYTYQGYSPPPSMAFGYPYQEPSGLVIVYTHGYAPGAQELQLARGAVLSLAATAYNNPESLTSVGIDDYHASYDALAARMVVSPSMKAALAKKYGRRAGLVRIG